MLAVKCVAITGYAAGAHSDTIHAKLAEMQVEIHESVVYCLKRRSNPVGCLGRLTAKSLHIFSVRLYKARFCKPK